MKKEIGPAARLPLLAAGFIALAFGVGAGLARMGWAFPLPDPRLIAWHGSLMIAGFFGTVISLERAVALTHPWSYLAPLAAALGSVALVAVMPLAAMFLFVAAGLTLLAASVAILLRQRALFTLTLVLGAGCWTIGNLLSLAGAAMSAAIPWWIGFLVLTIAGERLELSRFLPPSPAAQTVFSVIIAAIVGSLIVSFPFPQAGWAALAAGHCCSGAGDLNYSRRLRADSQRVEAVRPKQFRSFYAAAVELRSTGQKRVAVRTQILT